MKSQVISIAVWCHALEASDHGYKIFQCGQRTSPKAMIARLLQDLPDRCIPGVRQQDQFIHGRLANSTSRIIDDPLQRFFVAGIDHQPQIGNQVLHFFALIETDAAIDRVRNAHPTKRLFKRSTLCIGAI